MSVSFKFAIQQRLTTLNAPYEYEEVYREVLSMSDTHSMESNNNNYY